MRISKPQLANETVSEIIEPRLKHCPGVFVDI